MLGGGGEKSRSSEIRLIESFRLEKGVLDL